MARPYCSHRAYLNPNEQVQLAMRRNTANYTRWSLLYDRLPSGPSLDGAIPFFRREVWPYLVYHYVSGTLTEGIKEVLGLSDPYTVAYSREDFFLKTSSLFSETYRDFVRARCAWYEDSDLGVRGWGWGHHEEDKAALYPLSQSKDS
ncbi:hypothetical protein NLU13_5262 [Sarocladium strictum]|uniref:Uncharacterized protein n=1 Tax=Sarocladium strictum TaxID=5046 RepID=A0AA39GI53_SARSR|nr:hypothetical protein NLU13_5262 [Sarocladium strictum]